MIQRAIVLGLISLFVSAVSATDFQNTSRVAAAAPQADEAIGQVESSGTKRALIFCGLPGDKAHRKPFAETVEKMRATLVAKYGFAAPNVHVQFGGPAAEGEGPVLSGVLGQSTREEIESEAAELRKVLKPEDTLWVIVMGHSYFDGKHSHFNIPGPDINEQEFGKLFAGLPAREQVFFITIPTSGYYIKPLSAKGRVVVSATEADLEVNETIYPMALAEVLANPPAAAEFDADHDGQLTLFDLYIAVARSVVERYIKDEFLPTEHALLDDNGDGRGTELQIDYLTEAQGGRAKEGTLPRPLRETADGALSVRIPLLVTPAD
jgi:hypothetical protein